jgi:hypothetical protein
MSDNSDNVRGIVNLVMLVIDDLFSDEDERDAIAIELKDKLSVAEAVDGASAFVALEKIRGIAKAALWDNRRFEPEKGNYEALAEKVRRAMNAMILDVDQGEQTIVEELVGSDFELDARSVIPFLCEWWQGYEVVEVTRVERVHAGHRNWRKEGAEFQYEVDYRSDRAPEKRDVNRLIGRQSAESSGFPDGPHWGRGAKE